MGQKQGQLLELFAVLHHHTHPLAPRRQAQRSAASGRGYRQPQAGLQQLTSPPHTHLRPTPGR